MNNIRNILSVVFLICSVIILCSGIYILWNSIPTLILTLENSFFDKGPAVFQLLLAIYGFGLLSNGIIGIIACIAIIKQSPGAERFWLLLLLLHFIYFTLLEVSADVINHTSIITNIVFFTFVVALSWFAFCRSASFSLKANSKYFSLETILLLFIIFQTFGIYVLNPVEDNFLIKSSNQKKYGPYPEKLQECYELYEKRLKEPYENCNNFLISNGYNNDRGLLFEGGIIEILNGNKNKAIEFLNQALSEDYTIQELIPSKKMILFEEAKIHYILHLIYQDLGILNKSQDEYSHYVSSTKKLYGVEFSDKSLKRVKDHSLNSLSYFKNDKDNNHQKQ